MATLKSLGQGFLLNVGGTQRQVRASMLMWVAGKLEHMTLVVWKNKLKDGIVPKWLTENVGKVIEVRGVGKLNRNEKYGDSADLYTTSTGVPKPWNNEQETVFKAEFKDVDSATPQEIILCFAQIEEAVLIDAGGQGDLKHPTAAFVLNDGYATFAAKTFIADKKTLAALKEKAYVVICGKMYTNPANNEKSFTIKHGIAFTTKKSAMRCIPGIVDAYDHNKTKDPIDLTTPKMAVDDIIRAHNAQTIKESTMIWVDGVGIEITDAGADLTQVACADCDKLAEVEDNGTDFSCSKCGSNFEFKMVSRPTLAFKIDGKLNNIPSKADLDITAQVGKNNEFSLLGMDPKDIPDDADIDEIINDLIGKKFTATLGASNNRIIVTRLVCV